MTQKKKTIVFQIGLPLAVGALSALFAGTNMKFFETLRQPPLAPPGILFPIVWTILFTLMGIASYLVHRSHGPEKEVQGANSLYLLQLAVNFFWPIFFFRLQWFWFSFLWLLLLWVLIVLTILAFLPLSKTAAKLMIPYFLWVSFAAYLNLGIAILN